MNKYQITLICDACYRHKSVFIDGSVKEKKFAGCSSCKEMLPIILPYNVGFFSSPTIALFVYRV